MAALGVIGVVAFLIVLISRVIPAQQRAGKGALAPAQQWYGYFLAAIVLTIATLLFLWRFPPSYMAQIADLDWRLDARSLTFFVIMLVILALALLAFIVFVIWQQVNRKTLPGAITPAIETTASAGDDSAVTVAVSVFSSSLIIFSSIY